MNTSNNFNKDQLSHKTNTKHNKITEEKIYRKITP